MTKILLRPLLQEYRLTFTKTHQNLETLHKASKDKMLIFFSSACSNQSSLTFLRAKCTRKKNLSGLGLRGLFQACLQPWYGPVLNCCPLSHPFIELHYQLNGIESRRIFCSHRQSPNSYTRWVISLFAWSSNFRWERGGDRIAPNYCRQQLRCHCRIFCSQPVHSVGMRGLSMAKSSSDALGRINTQHDECYCTRRNDSNHL